VLTKALSAIDTSATELVTVFTGMDATDSQIESIQSTLIALLPDAEVDMQEGGQPHYAFVIGVE
jgi:dihydroxyacetone kinase-like predicted kinase